MPAGHHIAHIENKGGFFLCHQAHQIFVYPREGTIVTVNHKFQGRGVRIFGVKCPGGTGRLAGNDPVAVIRIGL